MKWDASKFRERLKSACKCRGTNLSDLSEASGIPRTSIYSWGRVRPPVDDLLIVAETLKVSPSLLAFGEGPELQSHEEVEWLKALKSLSPKQMKAVQTILTAFEVDAPGALDAPGVARTAPADSDTETGKPPDMKPAVIPIEAKPKKINRRDEIPVYEILKRSKVATSGKRARPHWYGLAAGPGRELERCPDYLYFRELPDWQGVHSAVVKGDSMEDTLLDGDVVLLQEFGGKLVLPAITARDEKGPMLRLRAQVPHDSVCVLSINDEEPTLKRVQYREHGHLDWHLTIVADNPSVWQAVSIGRGDEVTFYAKLIGRGQD